MKTHDVPNRNPSAPLHGDQLLPERREDTYRLRGKLPEPAWCPTCQLVYHKGKWQWLEKPEGAKAVTCPACHRIHDRYPAGVLLLRGPRLPFLHDELIRQIRNVEQAESAEHPLRRIMAIDDGDLWSWTVTTTDVHLARRLGEAIQRAHQGELAIHYDGDERSARVEWVSGDERG